VARAETPSVLLFSREISYSQSLMMIRLMVIRLSTIWKKAAGVYEHPAISNGSNEPDGLLDT
jgi:hypothetical protein